MTYLDVYAHDDRYRPADIEELEDKPPLTNQAVGRTMWA